MGNSAVWNALIMVSADFDPSIVGSIMLTWVGTAVLVKVGVKVLVGRGVIVAVDVAMNVGVAIGNRLAFIPWIAVVRLMQIQHRTIRMQIAMIILFLSLKP